MKRGDRPVGADLFCGVGGMSLGFEQAGFDVVAAADIEKINVDTYSENFPTCSALCADLASLSGSEFRRQTGIKDKHLDVVFAGPPCQGFSLIGKRLREDPRNRLLYDLARLIGELAPSYFVVENVAGILLGDAMQNVAEFRKLVEEAGYSTLDPIQILNAADFGVPQRRRRVFILGYVAGAEPPQYPKPLHSNNGNGARNHPTVWDAIGDLPRIENLEYLLETDEYNGDLGMPSAYAQILRGEIRDPDDRSLPRHLNGNGLGGCGRTVHTAKTIKRFERTEQGRVEEVSRFYRLSKNGLAPTLRAGTGPSKGSFMAPRPIHPVRDRCITVREAARLHSFPDWFQFHSTKWHGFRQIGNSVPPRLVRAVAESLRRAIESA
jgi:DNA (cytosine-5)-methyltransferase 1